MNVSTALCRDQLVNSDRDVFAHWAWAIPVLLIVAALGLRQIDLYPPSPDEFYTMYDLGWLANEARTPLQIVNTINENNPRQSPGYFLLLNLWGNLTGYSLPLGRVLGVFGGLLSLAITYRLAKDLVAPEAGLFAAIILASNAFYNMYVPFVRMYAMMVFIAGVSLWLYFRVTQNRRPATWRDSIALTISLICLLYTHGFSTLLFVTLGVYHAFFVPKTRAWYWLPLSMFLAILVFSPWLWVLFDAMTPDAGRLSLVERLSSPVVDSKIVIHALLSTFTNGQPLLMVLSATGIAFGIWKGRFKFQPYILLIVIFTILLFCVAEFTTWARIGTLRHHLSSLPVAVLFFAAGHYCLYKLHRWLGISVLFWILAGVAFQQNGDWNRLSQDRFFSVSRSPWHQVSRLGVSFEQSPEVFAYKFDTWIMNWRGYVDYSQKEHYFDNRDIGFFSVQDLEEIDSHVRPKATLLPKVWITLRPSRAAANEFSDISGVMSGLGYELCDSVQVGRDDSILQYSWKVLNCRDLAAVRRASNRLIDYRFYGSQHEKGESRILVIDEWNSRYKIASDSYSLSYQLMTEARAKVAQLDLPLAHEGKPRQFSIDITGVPAGTYKLFAILYNWTSKEQVDWIGNEGFITHILPLASVAVPESD